MIDPDLLVERLAAYYNPRAAADPSNPPSVRELGDVLKIGTTTACKYRRIAYERGLLCFPPPIKRRIPRGAA